MRKPVRSLALLSVAALAAGMGLSGSANAAQAGDPEVLAKGVPSPLSLAVAKDGSAYVTANFAGMLWHVAKGQPPEILYQAKEKNAEVGGVSVHQNTRHLHDHRQEQGGQADRERRQAAPARRRRQVRGDEEPRRRT